MNWRHCTSHGTFLSTGTNHKWEYMEDLCGEGGGHAPVAGDQVVDEHQHLELGQLVPGARVHPAPERREGARPRRHLQVLPPQENEAP